MNVADKVNWTPEQSRLCKTCGSYKPSLHPAMAFEGEVQICKDSFHSLCDYCGHLKGEKQKDPEGEGNRYSSCRGSKSDYRAEQCPDCKGVHWYDWATD